MNSEHPQPQTTLSADQTPIAWYDFGGTGPDLLLAHATSFCAMVWAPVVRHLRQYFRCLAYDMRGHGLSGRPDYGPEGWEWSLYAQDAQAVLQAAEVGRVFGVGHSCGGASEVLLEEQVPGTFESLYLFEPVIFPIDPPTGPDPERDLAVRARKRRPQFASRDEAIETFSRRGPFTRLDPETLAAYVDFGFAAQPDGSIVLRCHPGDEAEVYVMASNHNGFSHLDTVKCPTVVARGADSMAFNEADTVSVVDRLPDGQFVQLDSLTHFGPLEAPQAFAQLVIANFAKQS